MQQLYVVWNSVAQEHYIISYGVTNFPKIYEQPKKIIGATIQNIVARAMWHLEFMQLCYKSNVLNKWISKQCQNKVNSMNRHCSTSNTTTVLWFSMVGLTYFKPKVFLSALYYVSIDFLLQIVFWYTTIHPNVQLSYTVKQAVKISSCCHIQYTNLVLNLTNISKMQHELKKLKSFANLWLSYGSMYRCKVMHWKYSHDHCGSRT
jgi:hypothetical protein